MITAVTYRTKLLVMALLFISSGCSEVPTKGNQHASASATVQMTQEQLNSIANNLVVKHRFISNVVKDCPQKDNREVSQCYAAEITLSMPESLLAVDWIIHYSQVYPMYAFESEHFSMTHLNGDMHQIIPTDKFQGFTANTAYKIKLWVKATLISESQLFPNYWITSKALSPRVIESTRTSLDPETGLEVQPYIVPFDDLAVQTKFNAQDINPPATASWLFDNYPDSQLSHNDVKDRIIPTPKHVEFPAKREEISLTSGIRVSVDGFSSTAFDAALQRLAMLGVEETEHGVQVWVKHTDESLQVGGYHLVVDAQGVKILAGEASGAFYGLQSVAALLSIPSLTLPHVKIKDEPHYQYRGQHLDVARNFHSKEMVLALIRQMAAYKLNKLHLHLAEDEGWRLALPSFPELTEIGSKRCMSLADDTCLQPQLGGASSPERDGFYSVEDYIDILTVAKEHYIEVIPSLDMPGHSRAAIKAMEARYRHFMQQENEEEAFKYLLSDLDDNTQYRSIQNYTDNTINVCLESSYRFVDRVLEDLIALHKQAGHPLTMYHIGADETAGAWVDSPACNALIADSTNEVHEIAHLGAHFIERVSHMIASKGISVGGWNDGLGEARAERMPSNVHSYIWGALPWGAHQQASEQAHRGWQLVLSIPDALYFDFPYEIDPKERGYHWASRRVNSRTVFEFMPDNLPVHAEFRVDTLGRQFVSDDSVRKDKNGKLVHQPLPENFRVSGIQGQVWSETIRSDQQTEYMLYPRMIALAERAWHSAEWAVPYDYKGKKYSHMTNVFSEAAKAQRDENWVKFSATLGFKELAKLERAGIFYRLPTIGAKVIDGKLVAKSPIIGLPIEFREGNNEWRRYQQPTVVSGKVQVRARTTDGKRAGRSLVVHETLSN